jgi:hypothetical protein
MKNTPPPFSVAVLDFISEEEIEEVPLGLNIAMEPPLPAAFVSKTELEIVKELLQSVRAPPRHFAPQFMFWNSELVSINVPKQN